MLRNYDGLGNEKDWTLYYILRSFELTVFCSWIHYYPPLVQKKRFISQFFCFVKNGSRIASHHDDLLCSSNLHLKSTRDRVYL